MKMACIKEMEINMVGKMEKVCMPVIDKYVKGSINSRPTLLLMYFSNELLRLFCCLINLIFRGKNMLDASGTEKSIRIGANFYGFCVSEILL